MLPPFKIKSINFSGFSLGENEIGTIVGIIGACATVRVATWVDADGITLCAS